MLDTKELEWQNKLYFKIGEISQIAGIAPSVVRFWETEFNFIKPERSDTGQRLYRKKDLETIITIKNLLYNQKFTIAGAKKYLKEKEIEAEKQNNLLKEIKEELQAVKKILDSYK